MKTFVALVALFAAALADAPATRLHPIKPNVLHRFSPRVGTRPVAASNIFTVVPHAVTVGPSGHDAVVVKETLHNNDGLSGYQYSYELSDGTAREESAQVETRGAEDGVIRVRGAFRFVAPDGQTYTVTYVADENGFQPQGVHLPAVSQLH